MTHHSQNTSLTVVEKPNWRSEHPHAGYTKIIKVAGDDILLASLEAKGSVTLDTMDTDLMQRVLSEQGLESTPVFVVWDLSHVAAMSHTYKKETAQLIYNATTPLRGIVFYNIDPEFATTVETFSAIVNETVPVVSCSSFDEAIDAVERIRRGEEIERPDETKPEDSLESRKKEFLGYIGRLSWLNMLKQDIILPPQDSPAYPFFKAIDNLQSDLVEITRTEQEELEQVRKECDKILTEQTIQLNAQQELHKQLKQQLDKEKAELTSRIASQEMELTRISTAIAEKTSSLQQLLDIIKELDIDSLQKEQMIKSCENMIETEMIEKKLNIELTSTDSDFLLKLQKQHPNLNQRELRICLLIKLNYDTREIARSIGISTRGMESIRYRMHKKIGLSRHQSIKGYLTELAAHEQGA
ncbi:transcriptional regulator [Prosthecochloris sp. ZM_2]|uniref:transcriptional regulator n=1 Tax=Prosthecochloris sp. ZM_2 TaxID=2045206 RepID=UPI000DF744D6|nr:transcriptional regulator [Prosthecochloris sp. ZM_2]RNA65386.1 transcriptional regulator [Prosthecochloris sp. ZM_2]